MRCSLTSKIAPALALVLTAGFAVAQDESKNIARPESTTRAVDAVIETHEASWAEVVAAGEATYESWVNAQNAALEMLDLGELSAEGIGKLNNAGLLNNNEDARAKVADRIVELKAEVDNASVDAVEVAMLDFVFRGKPTRTTTPAPELQAALAQAILEHPKLHEAIKKGKVDGIGTVILSMRDNAAEFTDRFAALGIMLADTPPKFAIEGIGFWDGIRRLEGVEAEKLETIRLGLVAMLSRSIAATDAEGQPVLGNEFDYVKRGLARIDGPAARGELIGYDMPEMTIAWSSDSSMTSFEDLKGHVVVIDFWATWCGPCIGSFPKVQELKDHYAGKPVTIVGVTSLQGSVYGVPGEDGPVDTTNNASKEYELMPAVMERHGISWPVVFTEQHVFNPDFDVLAIPHVAILDANGKVRFNGLHPAAPMAQKTSKIELLLREMDVKPPVNEQAETQGEAAG